MKRVCMWLFLLNKRLLKKVSYVCILLMIPMMVSLFYVASQETAGVVTILLACEDTNDPFSRQIVKELIEPSSLIAFYEVTPEEGLEQVENGKADAVWIFPADLKEHIQRYSEGEYNGFIRVVEREQTVALRLSREKLSSAIYSEQVRSVFLRYVRENVPEAETVSDQNLLEYLDKTHVSGELFAFYDIHGNQKEESGNYLTAPLRGLLGILAVICAMVTAMYYQKDLDTGVLSLIPEQYCIFAELLYHIVSVFPVLLASMIALALSGLCTELYREVLLLVLFGLGCCFFSMLLRRVLGGRNGLAVTMPVVTIVMLVICPVFFDFPQLRFIAYLFPPSYYILGAYHFRSLLYLVIYDGVLLASLFLIMQIRKKITTKFL